MENESKTGGNTNDEQHLKKGRHRKKQLYTSILQQMEFYFSDSNLTKDRFLSQLLQENKNVDINIFLKFNKIRKLTSNVDDIKKAIKNSKLIQLSEDQNSVCRKEPIKEKPNVDECTIYVERLNADATHEWLSTVFSEFGNVVYVSLPRYKHSSTIKGFGFIEFEKQSEAEKALSYFESIGCKMSSNTEPEQLCSIVTFEKEEPSQENGKVDFKMENKTSEEMNSKRKIEFELEASETKKRKIDDSEDYVDKQKNPEENSESEDAENKKKKKLKKEHKKKNLIKELGLQVLSKQEWKRMRNRYLDLQRKKMKEFKQHLYKAKFNQANYEEKNKKNNEKTEKEKSQNPKLDFVEGVIVKLKMAEPITDQKKIKDELKSLSSDLQYVDLKSIVNDEIFLRFSNPDGARKFCSVEFGSQKDVITGEEEKIYWEKIQKDRENKFKKSNKKQRGRDKLLKKAKHIKFDD